MPGPYDSGNGNRGGSGHLNRDGSIHYTDYDDRGRNSWDEDRGDVSRIHDTDNDRPGSHRDYPSDNRGNPYDR